MEERDLDAVEAIEQSIFSLPWSKKSFLDAITTDSDIYLVCEIDNEIVGYCGLWTVFGEGNITNMAVAAEHRHKGYATLLMEAMEQEGLKKQVDIFFLEVRESNENARKLYEKMGYKQIGLRKNFYERPVEHALVMSKMYRKDNSESV